MRKSILIFLWILCLLVFTNGCKKDTAGVNEQVVAANFLSDALYTHLVVEVLYVNGYMPDDKTLGNLLVFLNSRLKKSGGISIVKKEIPATLKATLSLYDITRLEQTYRTQFTIGSKLTVSVLFLDADYVQNNGSAKVLGVAYGGSSVAIFEKTVHEFSGGITQPHREVLETIVFEHEFGHLLGLVNNGTAIQSNHQDSPHGSHCTDKSCLMYYNVETSDVVVNLLGDSVPPLDNACLNDLKMTGGK